MITLYDYQNDFVNNIITSLKQHRKVMAVLPTGGGKTFCFSYLVDYFEQQKKRIVILVHKEELVNQTVKSLSKFGVISEAITSRVKKPKHFSNVYVAMVDTAYNRLKKNEIFFKNVDYIIVDEAHILTFEKLFNQFSCKILGFTGTPVHSKKITFYRCNTCKNEYEYLTECCNDEVMEWTRPFAFSSIYDDVVVGTNVSELIEKGNLVKEIPIVKKSVDLKDLKKDKKGDFTDKSLTSTFSNETSLDSLVNDYMTIAKGKKTMIFTPSTKVNKVLFDKMESKEINVKMYDSVNSDEDRKELVKWFDNERDAVLINTNIFTTGFDVTDVECIMLYRATLSLSLFIQIVGRGARVTKKIFKDGFLLVDYGDNINRFGLWSDPTRDWEQIFWNGIGDEKPKKETMESIDTCNNCGNLFPKTLDVCPDCGEKPKPKKKREVTPEGYKLVPLIELPLPSGNKIVEYTKKNNEGVAFAFRIMINQICDLFRFYNVDKETYEKSLSSGEFDRKIDNMIQKCYFTIIRSDLQGGNRTLQAIKNKTKEKISKLFAP